MSHPDTKAAWKRRALRAESQLEAVQAIRSAEVSAEMWIHRERAALAVAVREIEEAIQAAKEYMGDRR